MKNKDDLIKGMFREHGVESPSSGFTGNVMEQITKSEEIISDRLLSPFQWVLISAGLAAAIFTIIFLDIPFLDTFFSYEKLSEIQFSGIGERFSSLLESVSGGLSLTPITIMIIAAILLLLGIERLLRYRQNQAQML